MTEFAGSLYIVSTAAFAVTAGVVGIRLLLLSRKTGQLSERLLGLGDQLIANRFLLWELASLTITFFPPVWYRRRFSPAEA